MKSTSRLSRIRKCIGALIAMGLAALAGCGDNKGSVSGTVKYKGELLTSGHVQFLTSAGASMSEIDSSGSYVVRDIPPGLAKIGVTCMDPKFQDYTKQLAASRKDKNAPRPSAEPHELSKIPLRYNNPETSELTFDAKSGSQTMNIELKD